MLAMDLSVWLTFFAAAWAISLSPGAGAVAAMSAGLNHGFRRGYTIAFGLITASGRRWSWWASASAR